MTKRLLTWLKVVVAMAVAFTVLAGCGSVSQTVQKDYPLESVVRDGNQRSYVYWAAGETVPQVAKKLTEQRQPDQMSKEDSKQMFLVYPDELYNLQQDADKPSDTIIEVSNDEFVRQNYSPSFLQGFLLASVLDNIFGGRGGYYGNYRGYNSRDLQKPSVDYRKPTTEEKRIVPPLTRDGTGSIIRRGDSAGGSGSSTPSTRTPSGGSSGKIIRSPDSGTNVTPSTPRVTTPPRVSPPRTGSGGGRIIRRR
ncbi:DUF4247 domain-containing protein [Ectobacillus ponti]|uniref:DUF4247 domain-containing protein n=1 Tax=Ectobacillus ponti TaxID=2961894 RepID=A0AA41XAT0_9BACI|nr:DUF4247 domain-containing protein [Ectobacillus ponti]MCP8969428.1 DUF4247 domain-containing protein [Ectobacillus ponti]